jgi:N4-gp56 family major capsid protein
MALHTYDSTAQRIGKFIGEVIAATMVNETVTKVGRQITMPKNNGKTYLARTWVPYGATAATKAGRNTRFATDATQSGVNRDQTIINLHKANDGVTGTSDSIVPLDYTATIQAYSCSYSFSRETSDLYEDDVPAEMKTILADRIVLVNEMIVLAALRSCTNVFYADTTPTSGVAATSIATTGAPLSVKLVRRISKNLMANNAKPMTKILKAGPGIATQAVGAAFFVFIHTDQVSDLRSIGGTSGSTTGFFPVEMYPNPADALPGEVGKIEGFRFIASPYFPSIINVGAAVGTTGCVSSNGTLLDVYPFIVMGQDAFCQIALRGLNVLDTTYIPCSEKSKSDPHGQRGIVGAFWYKSTLIENDGWMALGYAASLAV